MKNKDTLESFLNRINTGRNLLFEDLLPKCPDRLLNWRLDIATESFGEVLMYIGEKEIIWTRGLKEGNWDAPKNVPKIPSTIKEAVADLKTIHEELIATISRMEPSDLEEQILTPFKKASRIDLLYDLYEDFIHLRAVLFMFAKMNGISCPPMYKDAPATWRSAFKKMLRDLNIEKIYVSGCMLNQAEM